MDSTIKVYDIEEDYKLISTLEGPSDEVTFFDWHPKGNVIVCGSKDNSVWMFNGMNGDFI